jgi:polyhydroxybutyrate depolymerase
MRSVFLAIVLAVPLHAAEPVAIKWTVDGTTREGLIAAPAKAKETASPVVLVFHGHGGTAKHAARTIDISKHYPDAIVIWPQGLNTPGGLTDPEGKKSGWQTKPGDQKDRDLKLVDEILKQAKAEYKVDEKRIYSCGHSNGGAFTYLLWGQRPDVFAAYAPSAAVANLKTFGISKPAPLFHLGAENDPLVKFSWQQAGITAAKKVNGCDDDGKPWGTHKDCTNYASKTDMPVVTHITKGDHTFAKEGPELMAAFFKQFAKK